MPSQARSSAIAAANSGLERSASVSPSRRMKVPFARSDTSQLSSAVRALPIWRYPVGDGAKRTIGADMALYGESDPASQDDASSRSTAKDRRLSLPRRRAR